MSCPGGHVQESAHAFSFLGGLFGVRHTARAFLGFVAFESAAQTSVKEGVGVASDAYKRTVVEIQISESGSGTWGALPAVPVCLRRVSWLVGLWISDFQINIGNRKIVSSIFFFVLSQRKFRLQSRPLVWTLIKISAKISCHFVQTEIPVTIPALTLIIFVLG